MGFSPYSQIVNPAKWQAPVSEETLMKGAVLAEQKVTDFQEDFQKNSTDVLFGIKPMSPQDEKVLRQRQQEYMNDVSQVSMSDLNSPQARNFLNQIKNKYATDPDILGIAERSAKYTKDLETYQKLQEKGKPISEWRQKPLREAQEYINNGVYLTDKRFSGTITIDPNISKITNEAIKLAHDSADQTWTFDPKTGRYTASKSVSPEKILNSVYSQIQSDPQAVQYYNDLFEYENPNYNSEDHANSTYTEFKQLTSDIISNPASSPQDVALAKETLQKLESAKNSPEFVNQMAGLARSSFMKDQLQKHMDAYSFTQELEPKYDELFLARQKAAIQLDKETQTAARKQYMETEGFDMDEDSRVIIPPNTKVKSNPTGSTGGKKTESVRKKEEEYKLFLSDIETYARTYLPEIKSSFNIPEDSQIKAVSKSGKNIIIQYWDPNSGKPDTISIPTHKFARITTDVRFQSIDESASEGELD